MDLADASQVVTDNISSFELEAESAMHIADMMAYAQANSSTTAAELGEAYKNCGANMNAAGQDIETTTSMLESLANNGLRGSEAGTALAAVMRDMTSKMKDGKIAVGDTSVAVMDSAGNFRDMTDILKDVEGATDGMGDAQKQAALMSTFTSDSIKGLNMLLNTGADQVAGYEESLRNCSGAASDMADTMQDNLEGQLTILKSQLQELAISFGDLLMPAVRSIVSGLQGMVNVLNAMPDGVKRVIMIVALLAAALGPVLIIIGKTLSAIGTIMTWAPKLAGAISTVKGAFAALSATMMANPIAIVIAAIAALVAAFIYLWNTNEEFRQFWIRLWNEIKEVAVQVWTAVSQFLVSAWNGIRNTAVAVWNGIRDFFSGLWAGIKTLFTTVVTAISTFLVGAWNGIRATVMTVWNAISAFLGSVWNGIKSVITNVVNGIRTFLQTSWNGIRTIITTVMNAIRTVISTVWNGIRTIISTVLNGIRGTVKFRVEWDPEYYFLYSEWNPEYGIRCVSCHVVRYPEHDFRNL